MKSTRSAVTIADVLHYAADNFLASTEYEYKNVNNKHKYSCTAVTEACDILHFNMEYGAWFGIMAGLKEMGCPTMSMTAFGDKGFGVFSEENQHARYFWLKWAALMAEEQGV
jgi:hypothetical protein